MKHMLRNDKVDVIYGVAGSVTSPAKAVLSLNLLTLNVKEQGAFGDRAPAKVHKNAPPQALEHDY